MLDLMHSVPAGDRSSGVSVWLTPRRLHAGVERIGVGPGRTEIGSDSSCDITIDVAGIAPRHCVIDVCADAVTVTSVSAMTWLNESPIP